MPRCPAAGVVQGARQLSCRAQRGCLAGWSVAGRTRRGACRGRRRSWRCAGTCGGVGGCVCAGACRGASTGACCGAAAGVGWCSGAGRGPRSGRQFRRTLGAARSQRSAQPEHSGQGEKLRSVQFCGTVSLGKVQRCSNHATTFSRLDSRVNRPRRQCADGWPKCDFAAVGVRSEVTPCAGRLIRAREAIACSGRLRLAAGTQEC